MDEPAGFLLTFRTYGTWMHGDPRGSVDDEHNVYDTPLLAPSAARLRREAAAMRFSPLVFNPVMQRVVDDSIVDTCAYQKWELIERALRERRLVARDRPVWVDDPGSRRYLWNEQDIADAATYVRDYQDEPR
jgi:hypothetical protein